MSTFDVKYGAIFDSLLVNVDYIFSEAEIAAHALFNKRNGRQTLFSIWTISNLELKLPLHFSLSLRQRLIRLNVEPIANCKHKLSIQ